MVDGDDNHVMSPQLNDYMNQFIKDYEEKEKENKKKQKEKAALNKERKKHVSDFYEGEENAGREIEPTTADRQHDQADAIT
jgi:hypothetical protein